MGKAMATIDNKQIKPRPIIDLCACGNRIAKNNSGATEGGFGDRLSPIAVFDPTVRYWISLIFEKSPDPFGGASVPYTNLQNIDGAARVSPHQNIRQTRLQISDIRFAE
jgi:hypothetical protein